MEERIKSDSTGDAFLKLFLKIRVGSETVHLILS